MTLKKREFYGKPDPGKFTRRAFATGTLLASAGLAGCSDMLSGGDNDTSEETKQPTETMETTETQNQTDSTDEQSGDTAMQWDRRPDAEGGRVTAMWLLVEDGSILAELTIEDQRYRNFQDRFLTLVKDNDWKYEETWNVIGQFDQFGPAMEKATEELGTADAEMPTTPDMKVSGPVKPVFRGEEGVTQWYRRRDFEGGKEVAIWVLFDGEKPLEMVMAESNQYKHAYDDDLSMSSLVWSITPEESMNRDDDGTLNDDPAKWSNLTPYDDPHTTLTDAKAQAMDYIEQSEYPVSDGII
jgi:hypothetical protein